MTCKDCLHYEACKNIMNRYAGLELDPDNTCLCANSTDKDEWVHLPCKRGDTVFFIKSAFSTAAFPIEAKIWSIRGIDCDGDVMYAAQTIYNGLERFFKKSDIGKTVFLTKEASKKALAERQEK